MNLDDKTMLALAALTYVGFGHQSEAAIDRELRPWFPKLKAEGLGSWELAWGPATFRVPTSLVDDAMIYVARQTDLPSGARPRYAIAIRGTNPVSVFDWFFGDFWVQLQIDQVPPGTPPARLAASTALGLAIVQHLAAEVPPSSLNLLAPFANTLAGVLQGLEPALPELNPAQLRQGTNVFNDLNLRTRIDALTGAAGKALRSRFLDRLRGQFSPTVSPSQVVDQHVYDGLLRHIEATGGTGESLLQFLQRSVEPNARVAVTGHSKGGALAIAVALWLAEAWAPAHGAEIECFSFAGPTAGNAAFVQRYDALLAARTHRIVNPRDIVPHAWVPSELKKLHPMYPELVLALKGISHSVDTSGYTHVGGELTEIASHARPGPVILDIIHQHLDAYLTAAAYRDPAWNAQSLFLGA